MNDIKKILFLCPHAAAKSVLAMTYFSDLATKAGLTIAVANAGTDPVPIINPAVATYLQQEGFDLSGFIPRRLTEAALASADLVVSMGCIHAEQVPAGVHFLDWSDVPLPSEGFQASRDKIYTHVTALVAELTEAAGQ